MKTATSLAAALAAFCLSPVLSLVFPHAVAIFLSIVVATAVVATFAKDDEEDERNFFRLCGYAMLGCLMAESLFRSLFPA